MLTVKRHQCARCGKRRPILGKLGKRLRESLARVPVVTGTWRFTVGSTQSLLALPQGLRAG
jgi:hypothetical protein